MPETVAAEFVPGALAQTVGDPVEGDAREGGIRMRRPSGTHEELLAKQGVYYRLWNQLPGEDTL